MANFPQLITQPHGLQVLATLPQPMGLVPTMGALHRGHYSLLARARRECATVITSIYVNPLQFGPQEDFNRYPRSLADDMNLCQEAQVDVVFAPQQLTGATRVVPNTNLTNSLCGLSRPGHFTGVATVVLQLLNLIRPQRCYFGQKDAQQLVILQRVIRDLYLPVGIIPCATLRDFDGLALSSRNRYLSEEQRREAPKIYAAMRQLKELFLAGETDSTLLRHNLIAQLQKIPGLTLEYAELVDPFTLQPVTIINDPTLLAVAVRLGNTRLIDAVRLTQQTAPIIAIDGPAGAGKSTVAQATAQKLGFTHLDTGALYRAVTWAALDRQLSLTPERLTLLAQHLDLKLETSTTADLPQTRVWVDGIEVTPEIRSLQVSAQVSLVAAVPGVRQTLVHKQQQLGQGGGIVMEGRDIGTHVFPQAELKIFLTASPEERARRRYQDFIQRGETPPELTVLKEHIEKRDFLDSTRATAPLIQAPDALVLTTDKLTIDEVVARICTWAKYL